MEEKSAEEQIRKTASDYLWKAADFVRHADSRTSAATEPLTAADIADVQPNQLTRKLVEFYPTDLAPLGIRCESHRTASARQLRRWYDGDDANDNETGTSPDGRGIPETPSASSSSSRQAHHGSEHGLCVADGQPFSAAGAAAPTGTPPTPRRAALSHATEPQIPTGGCLVRNRTVGINARVTPAEKHRMETAARRCGLTLSEYLRQRALGYTPQFPPPASLFSALGELDALADRLPLRGTGWN